MPLSALLLSTPPWLRWALVLGWMGLIFFMSAQTDSGEQSGALARLVLEAIRVEPTPEVMASANHMLRKGAHFTEYFILASLIGWALPWHGFKRAGGAFALATLYAASDEFHQAFVPGRGPAVGDVFIDGCGALLAALVILGLEKGR